MFLRKNEPSWNLGGYVKERRERIFPYMVQRELNLPFYEKRKSFRPVAFIHLGVYRMDG